MAAKEDIQDIIVIPDLHGRLDALDSLLRATGFTGAGHRVKDSAQWLIQLGDLLDRGPRPRGCVQRLMDIQAQAPKRVFVLKGNHEDMALRAHDDPMVMRLWMSNGASATLADYEGRYESWLEPGGKHFEWLKALPLHLEHQNVLFCHAGLGKARKGRLTEEGLLWDRPPLDKGSYRAVVCAHTPTQSGHVEQDKGVWRCDLGLGHGMEQGLEALVLSVGPDSLSGRIVKV